MKLCLAIVLAFTAIASAAKLPLSTSDELDTRVPLPVPKAIRDNWHLFNHEQDSERIVGGTVVPSGGRPFQVALLRSSGSLMCGGSWISAQTVLCAAHCVDGSENNPAAFLIRSNTLSHGDTSAPTSKVVRVVKHGNYNGNTIINDVALLIVETPMSAGTNAGIVELVEDGHQPDAGTVLTVSGWGLTSGGGSLSPVLLQVELAALTTAECQSRYNGINNIHASMVCGFTTDKSACNGDSGGPLTIPGGQQVGIVSWGMSNCRTYPTVFGHVGNLRSWIDSNKQ